MKLQILVALAFSLLSTVNISQAQTWKQIGPDPIDGSNQSQLPHATSSGTVTDIAIDPSGSSDSIIYLATAGGGVWKTTDGGSKWSSKANGMSNLSMGAVSLDPSNPSVIYAGVGGPWCCVSGGGIYRSRDAAEGWTLLNPKAIFTGVVINRIVLPNSETLLVATSNGLYKSVTAGNSFGSNDPKFDDGKPIPITTPQGVVSNSNISDLKVDTATPTTVYAAVNNSGLFKSTNSGTNFPKSGELLSSSIVPFSQNVWITFA